MNIDNFFLEFYSKLEKDGVFTAVNTENADEISQNDDNGALNDDKDLANNDKK